MKKPSSLSLAARRARLALPISTLLVIGGLLASAVPVAAAESECDAIAGNLVTNCGFESGDLTGWTQAGNTAFTGVFEGDGIEHTGMYLGFAGPTGSTGSISQTLTTEVGRSYVLRFYLRNFVSGSSSFSASITDGGLPETLVALTNPPEFDYTAHQFTFGADSTNPTVTFTFRHEPSVYGLDDVSVVAVPSTELYFHANNGLNNTAPTATTPQQADSGTVKWGGGNVYQQVGSWSHTPSLGVDGDVHLWLGLKNSDDQGTKFDLKVVIVDGGSSATVYASCVTGVTRNPAQAKEVVIPVGYVGTPGAATQVTVYARIGTTDATTDKAPKCAGGHNNAVGLRLYYDSVNRPSGIWE